MNKKMGRPRLPKATARKNLFAVKLSNQENAILKDRIAESQQDRAEYGRNALLLQSAPVWIVSDAWDYDDLHGKSVEFDFKSPDGKAFIRGLGKVWVFRHRDNVHLAIEIHSGNPSERLMRIFLTQDLANAIQRLSVPAAADFVCAATVVGLERRH